MMAFVRAATVIVLLMASPRILACSCAGPPNSEDGIIEFADWFDLVFVGTVLERTQRSWEDDTGRGFELSARVEVSEIFKGLEDDEEIILWSAPPTCNASFELGLMYIFFARLSEEDDRFYTGLCSAYEFFPPGYVSNDRFSIGMRIGEMVKMLRELSASGSLIHSED